jgi:cardiolipin synthase
VHELTHDVQVIVQPDDGVRPVLALIEQARHSLRIKQFTFSHPTLLDAVIEAHRRGVTVQVMLNPARSSGDRANDATFEALKAAGVDVEWTNPRFAVTHEKSIVIDGERALIATFNLVEKYFTQTRDYGLVISDQTEVREIEACFAADRARGTFHPGEPSALLWSTRNSRRLMSAFIASAKHRLDIQHPKFVDAAILDRISEAAHRGVRVHLLCGGKHGISEWDIIDTFSSLRMLNRLDVKVHKQSKLRLHAKLLIADGCRALVGSMNIDRSAFDLRRELGCVVSDPAAIKRLSGQFASDWDNSGRYEAPDPLLAPDHIEDEFPHDPDLVHE